MPEKLTGDEQLENIASYIRDKFPRYEDMENEKAVKSFLLNHPDFIEHIPTDVGKKVLPEIFYTPGERLYEELGYRGPGFWGRVGYQFKNIAVSMYGAVPGLIGFDTPRIEAENAMKKMAESPDIQAYMAWREDDPVTLSNMFHRDIMLRGFSEMLPSMMIMIGTHTTAAAVASKIGFAKGLNPKWAVYTAMATMETSDEYMEAMRMLVDDLGYSPREAWKFAAPAAIAYGVAAGALETTPYFHFLKKFSKNAEKQFLAGIVRKYVKGNVNYISNKANRIKTDAAWYEVIQVGLWMMGIASMNKIIRTFRETFIY